MEKLKDAAYRAAGKHFQLNSVQQLSHILYEDLKLDQKASIRVKATTSRGAKSTSIPMVHINEVMTRNSNFIGTTQSSKMGYIKILSFTPVHFTMCTSAKQQMGLMLIFTINVVKVRNFIICFLFRFYVSSINNYGIVIP
jgi:hypothetical protein